MKNENAKTNVTAEVIAEVIAEVALKKGDGNKKVFYHKVFYHVAYTSVPATNEGNIGGSGVTNQWCYF